jgi:sulfate transport system permease protein
MASIVSRLERRPSPTDPRRATADSPWLKWSLLGLALAFLLFFLVLPLAAVFAEAFRKGAEAYFSSFADEYTRHAVWLTLVVAACVVPLNLVFGLAAAWAVAKYEFKGKAVLVTFIDLPFAVSPVIAGLVYVLIFSVHGWIPPDTQQWLLAPFASGAAWLAGLPALGGLFEPLSLWLAEPKIIFHTTGIVLATIFVTFPFVARELIPLMQAQGADEEYAAITLGASGWQTFRRVTLPNVKWGLFYGLILCNARAMGEFGAVAVVSGKIRGETTTMPLHIEILYNEYLFVSAFAVASLLALLALLTLVLKSLVEWAHARRHA